MDYLGFTIKHHLIHLAHFPTQTTLFIFKKNRATGGETAEVCFPEP